MLVPSVAKGFGSNSGAVDHRVTAAPVPLVVPPRTMPSIYVTVDENSDAQTGSGTVDFTNMLAQLSSKTGVLIMESTPDHKAQVAIYFQVVDGTDDRKRVDNATLARINTEKKRDGDLRFLLIRAIKGTDPTTYHDDLEDAVDNVWSITEDPRKIGEDAFTNFVSRLIIDTLKKNRSPVKVVPVKTAQTAAIYADWRRGPLTGKSFDYDELWNEIKIQSDARGKPIMKSGPNHPSQVVFYLRDTRIKLTREQVDKEYTRAKREYLSSGKKWMIIQVLPSTITEVTPRTVADIDILSLAFNVLYRITTGQNGKSTERLKKEEVPGIISCVYQILDM